MTAPQTFTPAELDIAMQEIRAIACPGYTGLEASGNNFDGRKVSKLIGRGCVGILSQLVAEGRIKHEEIWGCGDSVITILDRD